MADWWGNGPNAGKPVMPLQGDWWSAGGPAVPRTPQRGAMALPAPPLPPQGQAAKDLDFKAPGAGLANAGIDEKDMYPRFEKLRAHSTEKGGGNAQLWKNLDRWETTPNAQHVDPEQKKLFDHYHATGERLPGLKDSTVAAALDWGVREGTRSQMHKENFFDSGFGRILGTVGQIAASFIPVVGPYASMAIGALHGGLKSKGGGPLGALAGAASGYGVGSGTQFLTNGFKTGFGALNNINAYMPVDIAARAGTGTANTAFSLGTGGRLIEKGASATARALRDRQLRQQAEDNFRRQIEGPRP